MAAEQDIRLDIRRSLPGAQAEEALSVLLMDQRPQRVFVTPLYTFDLSLLAARFPGILFIREQFSISEPPPRDNLVRLVYNREQSFFQAGEAAVRLAASLGNGQMPGSRNRGVGILSVPLSERGRRELAAFRAGFHGYREPGGLVERRVDPASDRVQARRMLEEMRQEGVMLILLKAYELTTFCLEELKKQGGWAIVEDYEGNVGYQDVVLLSIEDDLGDAFAESLSADLGTPVLQGKTYLRWGDTETVGDLRKELDFVRE